MHPLLALLLGAALALAAGPPFPRSADVRVTPGDVYRFDATVTTDSPASGTYEMVVRKDGRSGRSDSRQSGAFEAGAGTQVLSSQSVGLSAGDHVRATLTVTWDDGQTVEDSFEETVRTSAPR